MNRPSAQEAVVHQGATSVAVGQWVTSTSEVTMLTVSPAIVIRLGATHSGTSVTNLQSHVRSPLWYSHIGDDSDGDTTYQFQYFCIIGSSRETHDELYLWSFRRFSSLSLKI